MISSRARVEKIKKDYRIRSGIYRLLQLTTAGEKNDEVLFWGVNKWSTTRSKRMHIAFVQGSLDTRFILYWIFADRGKQKTQS